MKVEEKLLALNGGGFIPDRGSVDAARGMPVFFCHGWPSSRTMAELTDAAGRDLGVRIISPDRPGISRSSFQSNRRLLDWPAVLRQLADPLELERFHLLAVSGGG